MILLFLFHLSVIMYIWLLLHNNNISVHKIQYHELWFRRWQISLPTMIFFPSFCKSMLSSSFWQVICLWIFLNSYRFFCKLEQSLDKKRDKVPLIYNRNNTWRMFCPDYVLTALCAIRKLPSLSELAYESCLILKQSE
jgi:hypothetical protein